MSIIDRIEARVMTAQQQLAELKERYGDDVAEVFRQLSALPEYDRQRDRFYIRYVDGSRAANGGTCKESQAELQILARARLALRKLTQDA